MHRLLCVFLFLASPALAEQPQNISDLRSEVINYIESGSYLADQMRAVQPGIAWLEWRASQNIPGEKLALVLDIDETSLSNMAAQRANGFSYFPKGSCDHLPEGPCAWDGWIALGQAAAIAPTLELFNAARANGIDVFFITGRYKSMHEITVSNLEAVGFSDWSGITTKPEGIKVQSAADYKAPARLAIEEGGYTIVLNVGDQPSDLAGGYAERTILLPNPMYRIP
jgi:predicted secreted acid phosphatase